MGNLFKSSSSKSKANTVTEQDKAVLQIKQQRDKVKQFQKKLVVQLESETEIIKQLVQKGQKQKALLLLRKKKYTEKILDKTDTELFNIESLITDIEFKRVEESVIKGIQIGNETLKQLNAVFSIEQIESILEETEEGVAKQQEINDLISSKREGEEEEEDEAALDAELASILGVHEEEDINLPDVPTSKLPAKAEAASKKPAEATATKSKNLLVEA